MEDNSSRRWGGVASYSVWLTEMGGGSFGSKDP